MTEKKPRLRWKKNPRPKGLAGIGHGHPGHTLYLGDERQAMINKYGNRYSDKDEFFWVTFGNIPFINTAGSKPLSESEAKAAAMEYVRKHLKK